MSFILTCHYLYLVTHIFENSVFIHSYSIQKPLGVWCWLEERQSCISWRRRRPQKRRPPMGYIRMPQSSFPEWRWRRLQQRRPAIDSCSSDLSFIGFPPSGWRTANKSWSSNNKKTLVWWKTCTIALLCSMCHLAKVWINLTSCYFHKTESKLVTVPVWSKKKMWHFDVATHL